MVIFSCNRKLCLTKNTYRPLVGSSQIISLVAEIAGDDYLEILINLYSILDRMLPTHVLKTAGFYLYVPIDEVLVETMMVAILSIYIGQVVVLFPHRWRGFLAALNQSSPPSSEFR